MVLEHLLTALPRSCSSSVRGAQLRAWEAEASTSVGLALALHRWHRACHAISWIIHFFFFCWKQQRQQIISGKPETPRANSLREDSWSHTLACRAWSCHINNEAICLSSSVFVLEVCCGAVFQHKLWAVWFGNFQNVAGLRSGTMPFDGRLSESTDL